MINARIRTLLTAIIAAPLLFGATAAQADGHEEAAEVVVTSEMELPADGVWMHSFDA